MAARSLEPERKQVTSPFFFLSLVLKLCLPSRQIRKRSFRNTPDPKQSLGTSRLGDEKISEYYLTHCPAKRGKFDFAVTMRDLAGTGAYLQMVDLFAQAGFTGITRDYRMKKIRKNTALKNAVWPAIGMFLLAMAPTTFAQAQVDFSNVVTFGDSLTHNDLLGVVAGKPQDLYGKDPMEAVFEKAFMDGDQLRSYAIAGAQSDQLRYEIYSYEVLVLTGEQDRATLISVEAGGNDILNNIKTLSTHAPGLNPSADQIVTRIQNNIQYGLRGLQRDNPDAHFVVWTIPDVTLTPSHWNRLSEQGAANVRAHIEQINRWIRTLDELSSHVVLDLYTLAQRYIESPPMIGGQTLVPPPSYGNYIDLFADGIHPTAVSNALIANVIISKINEKWNDSIPTYTESELEALAGFYGSSESSWDWQWSEDH